MQALRDAGHTTTHMIFICALQNDGSMMHAYLVYLSIARSFPSRKQPRVASSENEYSSNTHNGQTDMALFDARLRSAQHRRPETDHEPRAAKYSKPDVSSQMQGFTRRHTGIAIILNAHTVIPS